MRSARTYESACSAIEVGTYREHAAVAAVGRGEPELVEDGRDVALDGAFAEEHARGDLPVGEPFRHRRQHVALAIGERVQRSRGPAPAEHLSHDLRVEHR